MRVFVTGATGFIGSAVVKELIGAGHKVLGLARSDAAARALTAAGVEIHRGDLADLDSLKHGATAADGVIHTAFNNVGPGMDFAASCRIERTALEAIGEALAGSDKPLVMTSGTALLAPGRLATEEDTQDHNSALAVRSGTEEAVLSIAGRGVRAVAVRLPLSVHGDGDHGFVPALIAMAREKGVSAYVGDGRNRWPAVHRLDAARLFRLALENGPAGSRFHGVADEGVPFRDIAALIGRRLNVPVVSRTPEEAGEHFAWMALFTGLDAPASSAITQERLGWRPTQPGIIADLERSSRYFSV
jgi:nucleoside-diphosphate-sugar epimerase